VITRSFPALDEGRQCHASTVAVAGGHPVVAWFAGTREGTPDNRVHVAGPGGTLVLDTGRNVAHWNPVLAPGPDTERSSAERADSRALWLFCKVGARISEWVTLVTRSHDGGGTWEPVRELVPGDRSGGRRPVKNPPLVTPDGLWLAPASVEEWGERPRWSPFVDVSADGGRTWERAPIPVGRSGLRGAGHIQPALWWGPSGPVALMRSGAGEYSYPTAVLDGDRLLVSYTWQRRGIVLAELSVGSL
jgi:predicted neuraminidase